MHSLERRLKAALPEHQIVATTVPRSALEQLQVSEFSLVITDVRMPGLTGLQMMLAARERWPGLPFIVMTAFPTESVKREAMGLGSAHYIEKPFAFPALLEIVEKILRQQDSPGFSGAVSSATLPDLMQLFFMSGSTGALRVWHAEIAGSIWFDHGAILHATAGALAGQEAVFEMVSWGDGKFAMDLNVPSPARTIHQSTTGLVLEALRRFDERKSGRSPSTEDADGDVELIEQNHIEFIEGEENHMANNVQSTLERLRTIDGYVGACIVDSESAMSLGSDGGGAMLNLDIAAAGNAEVVKAKRKAMRALGLKDEIEDILITLGRQYHLIRLSKTRPSLFIYVALDRARANLAMARMAVADAEKSLEI